MVRKIFCFILCEMAFLGAQSLAESAVPVSCLPEVTSLQSYETWSSHGPQSKVYSLKSGAQAELFYNQDKGGLEITLSFEDPEAMSLPFNLYALMVTTEAGDVIWRDFTSLCKDPGISFFPGTKVRLDPIVLKLQENESYRVMIWGRM